MRKDNAENETGLRGTPRRRKHAGDTYVLSGAQARFDPTPAVVVLFIY